MSEAMIGSVTMSTDSDEGQTLQDNVSLVNTDEEDPPPQYDTLSFQFCEETERSLDDVLTDIKFGRFHILIILLGGTAYFAVCSELMVFVFLNEPIKKEWHLSDMVFPWLPFCNGLASMFGEYLFGILSDRHGRQFTFVLTVSICCIFAIGSTFATNFPILVVFRSFVSFGKGGLAALAFVLPIEFLPRQKRSYLIIITMCGTLGTAFTGAMAWLLIPTHGWRYFVVACATPFLITLIFRLFARYESPRFLMISGEKEQAWMVVTKIAQINKTPLPAGKLSGIPSHSRGQIKDLFTREFRYRTLTISLVWLFQATGYWGVTTYLPQYMSDKLNLGGYFIIFIIFISELPGLFLALFFIRKNMLGRITSVILFICMTIVLLAVFAVLSTSHLIWAQTLTIMTCFAFMAPIYSILNTFTPEIYPTAIRSTALGWVYMVSNIPGLITPFIDATLLDSPVVWLYPVVWLMFFVLEFVVMLSIRTETAGKRLSDNLQSTPICENIPSFVPDHIPDCTAPIYSSEPPFRYRQDGYL
ncbi:vesicle 2-related 7-like [Octopus vulgaris]|uniref:Vesicle 2-related 7-like n=2 Tax=Octopus TaxID=6643 RepID=A0AA36AUN1_OCTVU|nr:organic cation/carnitine transporter 7-like [Octopus sinensis]CAI9722613.1 vesicle 2-related 7-like [Octopus vulgaris]